ncbi:uracil-DNA glycosylase family protein [Pelagibaculum spongiae]|uniref:Uracil-DNA glycosylase-like domain-containing protein n=1 Tax=Pelagibaculum spongiae TaxID=2080658 RepID=A0A2V1H2C9_9GAMM|nr:uracil-DNA glycosylase family protein [Pelagibaculum spongiae]PVZ72120.1 hypothetical protein DC094_03645 [Pelagibaculum spongiae]
MDASSTTAYSSAQRLACLKAMDIDCWVARSVLPGARQPQLSEQPAVMSVVDTSSIETTENVLVEANIASTNTGQVETQQLEDFPDSFAQQLTPQVSQLSVELDLDKARLIFQPLVENASCEILLIVGYRRQAADNVPLLDHNSFALLLKIAQSVGLAEKVHIAQLVNPANQHAVGALASAAPLKQQLEQLPVKKIVLLGEAVKQLWGNCRELGKIENSNSGSDSLVDSMLPSSFSFSQSPHPSELLAEPLLKRRAWHDWKQLKAELVK